MRDVNRNDDDPMAGSDGGGGYNAAPAKTSSDPNNGILIMSCLFTLCSNLILSAYLPKQMTEDEIRAEIAKLDDKKVPSVMKHFKANFAGKCDMGLVSKVCKEFN